MSRPNVPPCALIGLLYTVDVTGSHEGSRILWVKGTAVLSLRPKVSQGVCLKHSTNKDTHSAPSHDLHFYISI